MILSLCLVSSVFIFLFLNKLMSKKNVEFVSVLINKF